MSDAPDPRRQATAAALWLGLWIAVSAALFLVFTVPVADRAPGPNVAIVSLGLGGVVTLLALLTVIVDRILFARNPRDLLGRQSVWVLFGIALTVGTTGAIRWQRLAGEIESVLFAVSIAIPTTIALFATVQLLRHDSLEQPPEER